MSVSIGIDVGTGSVTTAVVSRGKDGALRLAGVGKAGAEGVRRGVVTDPELLAKSIKKSINIASRESDITIRSAAVAFGGFSIRSSTSRGVVAVSRADGEITGEDVRRSLHAAESLYPTNVNREIIHLTPREFWVDGEGGIKNPVGMVGMRLEAEALIIDGDKRSVQNLVKAFDAAGIGIDEWVFTPIATAEAVLSDKQKELGVMLLDIGAGTSDYAIFREGSLLDAGTLPVGGDLATHDIAVMFKTKVEVAEAVKCKYGHVDPEAFSKGDIVKLAEFVEGEQEIYSQRELAEVIRARMADVFELAGRALRHNVRNMLLPAGVVLAGGASLLPGIREFAKKEMRLPVEHGVLVGLDTKGTIGAGPTAATAVGVALWSFKQSGGTASSGISRPLAKGWETVKNLFKIFLP